MHSGDARMAETGDMFANRQKSNSLLRALIPWLIGFGSSERFTPDTLLEDGASLHDYGLEAEVIWTPGHSRGSIGILTGDGRFFCGDLLVSTKRPAVNSLIDDPEAIRRSIEKLRTLKIETVYPGHGKPFSMDQLSDASR
jgi:glyoxylase-like metal-dependent hydrolase (beta-lactamase superfamily II)